MMNSVFLTIFTAIFGGYLWLRQRYLYWEKRRVPHLKPDSWIFGNNRDEIIGKTTVQKNSLKLYNQLAPNRFGGIYHFCQPLLYIRDPELIKNVLIKDFDYFRDRNFFVPVKQDPLSHHLFNVSGEEWTMLRRKLSPTFTSGKMKMLFDLMKECVNNMKKIVDKSSLNHETVKVNDLMGRYTTDVISSCAFGLEAGALNNPNSVFRVRGKEAVGPTLRKRFRDLLFALNPILVRILQFRVFPQYLTDFFINLVSDTIKYRTKNKVVRNDFLNLLLNIRHEETEKMKNFDFSLELLTAQCFVFFLAGFETSSNTLGFVLCELSEHQDIQKRLQKEVDHVLGKHDGQITYDSLQEMHYMDQVINETLRLFPIVSLLRRVCLEQYQIPDSDYYIERGESVIIPVYALHRDPQYYPNPDVFDPENFSEDAKNSRPSCCFLPFGDGPRNCIGMRFAIMQVKLALTTIMREFFVTLSPEMKLPIELVLYSFVTTPKNEIVLNFNKRDTSEMNQ